MNCHRVLVLQTASPSYVKRAMKEILAKELLGPVHITLFSRALPDELSQFRGISWIDELSVHHESRAALKHLRELRRGRFDVVVAFFTRDPSYWKMKLFVFLCGGRHLLLFNEHLGCFFFTPSAFLQFLLARFREWRLRSKQKLGYALGTSQVLILQPASLWLALLRPLHLALKVVVFPFRFLYLLVWTAWKRYQRRRFLRSLGARISFQSLD